MAKKYVYLFDEVKNANSEEWIFRLGNKGAQLAEMTSIGLPVPPGFTVSTEACNEFYDSGKKWPEGLESQVKECLAKTEAKIGKKFGDPENPLLFSVRSGSYVSMPGMMDTVLNLGLNDETVKGLAHSTKNERGAYDSYRRFIHMFGDVVMGVQHEHFEEAIHALKAGKGVKLDTELSVEDLKVLVEEYKAIVQKHAGKSFPNEAFEQLKMGINAVFSSWNVPRAVSYRRINKLKEDAGTGVNVQVMVFGNMGEDCGTGVSFTRNPATGEKEHYGEFLINAQGEDVVAGIRTPQPVDEMKKSHPKVYAELLKVYDILEKHYRDLQDFEFTFEHEKLFLLQTRSGKRTAKAAVKIAVDMEKEKLIDRETAIMRVKPEQLDQLLHKQFDEKEAQKAKAIASGIAASPGAAVGQVVFTAEKAKALHDADANKKLILVRVETTPEDIEGMNVAQGILTARGGSTSHAAVVARGMGKCCVAGSNDIHVSYKDNRFSVKTAEGEIAVKENDWVSLDGSTGKVYLGKLPLVEPKLSGDFGTLMEWADAVRKLKVRTNADTPHDSDVARKFGAEGIGLCRTEHMFFEGSRIKAMREMILAETTAERRKALDKLLPFQREDFKGIFKAMDGLPVTIRLLDPPLHEFLPEGEKEIAEIAQSTGVSVEKIKAKIASLHEINPMLGFRGCRLGIVFPEINEMQVRAIIEAAVEAKEKGVDVRPEIMIPVLNHVNEMKNMAALVDATAKQVLSEKKADLDFLIGVMMELPRACLTADDIAEYAEFFSFGTNDLTQTTWGYSRDDAAKFIPAYMEKKIIKHDPFQVLDQEGVGQLIRTAVQKGRSKRENLKIGICGEHGGEPSSVEFCHTIGLNYVSCSPYRVPIARLAAAQAALKEKKAK
ncbi:MAG: pyruvate, phosphate dikinase [Candidatus Diapherotrites archaeon]|nr:pyruvate, phosphate dikinase [Candidatus Diapherotrites archaeon]